MSHVISTNNASFSFHFYNLKEIVEHFGKCAFFAFLPWVREDKKTDTTPLHIHIVFIQIFMYGINKGDITSWIVSLQSVLSQATC